MIGRDIGDIFALSIDDLPTLTRAARMALAQRTWPGNIRELINTLDVAVALCEGRMVELEDLPAPILAAVTPPRSDDTNQLSRALEMCDWNLARTARHLGVNRSAIHRQI